LNRSRTGARRLERERGHAQPLDLFGEGTKAGFGQIGMNIGLPLEHQGLRWFAPKPPAISVAAPRSGSNPAQMLHPTAENRSKLWLSSPAPPVL
jgi:hypothetical protein